MYRSDHKFSNYFYPDDFYIEAKHRIDNCEKNGGAISIVTLDVDHFNYINDLFGYETGDLVLKKLTEFFSVTLNGLDIYSRIHADIFAFCVNFQGYGDTGQFFSKLTDWKEVLCDVLPSHYILKASGGIVVVQDSITPVSALIDKANHARQKIKGTMGECFRFFDEKLDNELQWQKVVTLSMESALKNREFEMYLQPKVYIKSDQIVGAEALVRWRSPQHGLVAPDRFIPILEQNGFIRQLDFFMLEEACRFLKESAENGIPQVPISVNFSKIHLISEHLVEHIFQTVNRMGINTRLIEIEFTESLSVEGFERLIEVAGDLKLLGFRVSLDDFGSAYSSLNCLKELPIDIIKIDKAFLSSSTDTEKGKMIIAKMVELIKSLRMLSVMEGVETSEQVDFLRKMSCDFGQGYFYAKPMPTADYINYLKNDDLLTDILSHLPGTDDMGDSAHRDVIPQEFQMDNWELYTLGKNIDMGLMKGYLDEEATVQYINDRALEYLGYTRQEFREICHNKIVAFTHPDDVNSVQVNTEQLLATGKPLKFQARAIRKDGKVIFLQGSSSCVIDDHGRPVGLYAFQDVTEELERTQALQRSLEEKIHELEATVVAERNSREALRFSEERYRVIVEQSDDIMFDWDFEADTIFLSDKYVKLFGQMPYMEHLTTSPEIRERIYPADLPGFERWIASAYRQVGHFTTEFRCKDLRGKYIWLRGHSTAIVDEAGNALRAVGLFSNIDAQKNELDALTLKSQRDPLTQLLNKEETKIQTDALLAGQPDVPGALFMIDIDNFKELNDNLGHQFGDTVLVEFTHNIQTVFAVGCTAGRIGGDEFVVYVPGIEPANLNPTIDALMKALHINYNEAAAKYNICGSVGISYYPAHGKSFDELYRFADIALYESKRAGKSRYTVYQEGMTVAFQDKRTPVERADSVSGNYFQGNLSYRIFEMLYETKDMNTSIHMILELLGKRFGVDHIYIFQNEPSNQWASNTHDWCSPMVSREIEILEMVRYQDLGDYLSQYNKDGVFCCTDVRTTCMEIRQVCEREKIKSFLHCAIYNEGAMMGFVGFDMCMAYHEWSDEEIAVLSYFSRMLSVFLIKSNAVRHLNTASRNL